MPSVKLQGRAIKVSIMLDPTGLIGVTVPNGQSRFPLTVEAGGLALQVELSAKSVRRACSMVAEDGPAAVGVLLQGKLVGNRIEDAGIAATPRQPNPAPAPTELSNEQRLGEV
jgi:hypothetical protein